MDIRFIHEQNNYYIMAGFKARPLIGGRDTVQFLIIMWPYFKSYLIIFLSFQFVEFSFFYRLFELSGQDGFKGPQKRKYLSKKSWILYYLWKTHEDLNQITLQCSAYLIWNSFQSK